MPINTVSLLRCVNTYGALFTQRTFELLPDFIMDAREIARILAEGDDD